MQGSAPGSSRMFARLVWTELRRLVCRRRAWLVIVGLTIAGAYLTDHQVTPDRFWDLFGQSMPFGCVIAAVVVASGSFAEDRRLRRTRMVLLRGYSRRSYAWAKALATAGSTALVTWCGFLGFVLAARLRLPPDIWTRPLLPDMLPLALLAAAAVGLASIGFFVGVATGNEYVAAVASVIVPFVLGLILYRSRFDPMEQLDAWRPLVRHRVPRLPVYGTFLYWLGVTSFLSLLGSELFARSEKD